MAGHPMRLAGPCPMRRSPMPSLFETMPPSRSAEYVVGHDVGMLQAMESLLEGLPGDARQQEVATQIASLPMQMGEFGIRSVSRVAQSFFGASWASWAGTLPMLQNRLALDFEPNRSLMGYRRQAAWRASNNHTGASSQRFHQPSRVARIAGESTSSPSTRVRAWRVAAWLAVLRVFRFRTPFSGDGCACPIMCRRPGPSSFSFGGGIQRRSVRLSHMA